MIQTIETSRDSVIDRRCFLTVMAAAGVSAIPGAQEFTCAAEEVKADSPHAPLSFPGLILREHSPLNLEFPFPTLNGSIVSNHRFFVRNHFPIPKTELSSWRLKVEGNVQKERDLTYEALRKLPSKTVEATLECAGNSRGFLVPKAKGVAWELGAVGNAKWTGVPLSTILEHAGIGEGTVEVILEGADSGEINDDPKSPGPIHFARSLPLKKAQSPEVLIAYQMNGEDLPPEHGFPVRAVVSGWYGMASVKWLSRIRLTKTPYRGYWQTMSYTVWERDAGLPTSVPIRDIQVKAEIARPCLREIVPAGAEYRIFGAAWAGENKVATVEVSTDAGKTWTAAKFASADVPFSWRLWETHWKVPNEPGSYRLMAKATDNQGRTQTATHNRDHGGYLIHHMLPIDVEVRRV